MPDLAVVLDDQLPACPACGAPKGEPCSASCETRSRARQSLADATAAFDPVDFDLLIDPPWT